MANTETATIFLADDHPIFIDGLRHILSPGRFTIIGEATNGKEALERILALRPDIAVLDISMPELSGIEVARELRKSGIKTKVILLSALDGRKYLDEAITLGLHGYVLKDNTGSELLDAIGYAQKGKTWISPVLSERIMKRVSGAGNAGDIEGLTAAERKVLSLLAEGKTCPETGLTLHCSPRTVENHRANICAKLTLSKGRNALLDFTRRHKDLF